jgi:hypothetical protein
VLGNRVLRRIFVLKRDEVTREWRKLHNDELNNLFPTFNTFQMINSRRVGLQRHEIFSVKSWGIQEFSEET